MVSTEDNNFGMNGMGQVVQEDTEQVGKKEEKEDRNKMKRNKTLIGQKDWLSI